MKITIALVKPSFFFCFLFTFVGFLSMFDLVRFVVKIAKSGDIEADNVSRRRVCVSKKKI